MKEFNCPSVKEGDKWVESDKSSRKGIEEFVGAGRWRACILNLGNFIERNQWLVVH